MVEFLHGLDRNVVEGMGQAAVAIALCVGVVIICRRLGVHVERETVLSLARGLVQMVAVGVVLALLLHGNLLIAVLILLGMTFAAAVTASRRAPEIKDAVILSFYAIAAGSSVVIAVAARHRNTHVRTWWFWCRSGSMIIANAMNACAQAMERFRADVTAHVGLIETGLALGAEPAATVAPLCSNRRLREPASPSRHAQVAWLRLDPWRYGRYAGVRRQSGLRGHFSVHRRCHDPGRFGHQRARGHPADAGASFLAGRAIDSPSGYFRSLGCADFEFAYGSASHDGRSANSVEVSNDVCLWHKADMHRSRPYVRYRGRADTPSRLYRIALYEGTAAKRRADLIPAAGLPWMHQRTSKNLDLPLMGGSCAGRPQTPRFRSQQIPFSLDLGLTTSRSLHCSPSPICPTFI